MEEKKRIEEAKGRRKSATNTNEMSRSSFINRLKNDKARLDRLAAGEKLKGGTLENDCETIGSENLSCKSFEVDKAKFNDFGNIRPVSCDESNRKKKDKIHRRPVSKKKDEFIRWCSICDVILEASCPNEEHILTVEHKSLKNTYSLNDKKCILKFPANNLGFPF